MTIIPDWAKPYFVMTPKGSAEENRTHTLAESDLTFHYNFFTRKKKEFERTYSQMNYPSALKPSVLEEYARNYVLCITGLALLDLEKARRQKANGENHVNDGNIRQHWIPRCYMTQFSQIVTGKGEMVRKTLKRLDTTLTIEGNKTPLLSEPVSLNGIDFKESKAKKGLTYSDQFELVLSKLETDYSNFRKHSYLPANLWDYFIIATFFIVFSWRTPEQMQAGHTPAEVEAGLRKGWIPQLVDPLPKMIANLELNLIHRTQALREDSQALFNSKYQKRMRLPFSLNPFYIETEPTGFSIWCVYSPDYLLWLKPSESKHNYTIKDSDFFSDKLMRVIQNHDYRDLYFDLHDEPWEVLIGNENDKANVKFNNIMDTNYLGFGPLRPTPLRGFSASNFEIGTTRLYPCDPNRYHLVLNIGNLKIAFRSIIVKHAHKKLHVRNWKYGWFNVTELTSKRDTEIFTIEVPNLPRSFYSK